MSIVADLKMQLKSGGITTKLIFLNVLLFVVPFIIFSILQLFNVNIDFLRFVSLSSDPSDLLWKPWSLITYNFFHAGIWHILFNMIMLQFSGRLFLTFFTEKQLLGLYLMGGIFAGLIYILCYMFFPALVNINTSLIGASASVMAILMATVTYSPMMNLRLLIIGNVKLWHIAVVLIILDLIQISAANTGGHLAHLGGAFFGYLYIVQLKNGRDLGTWMTIFDRKIGKRKPFRKVHKTYSAPQPKPVSRIIAKDKTQQQIDEILDKISRSGYDSLTAAEKDFLFRAGKQ